MLGSIPNGERLGRPALRDFGLGWNQLLETGGVVVGDEVKLSIDSQVVATPSSEPQP